MKMEITTSFGTFEITQFGSQITGAATVESDYDVALFIPGISTENLNQLRVETNSVSDSIPETARKFVYNKFGKKGIITIAEQIAHRINAEIDKLDLFFIINGLSIRSFHHNKIATEEEWIYWTGGKEYQKRGRG